MQDQQPQALSIMTASDRELIDRTVSRLAAVRKMATNEAGNIELTEREQSGLGLMLDEAQNDLEHILERCQRPTPVMLIQG